MGAKHSKKSKNILTPSSSPSGSAENSQTRHAPAAAAAAATKPVTKPLHENENVEDLDADACSIPESDASHLVILFLLPYRQPSISARYHACNFPLSYLTPRTPRILIPL